MFKNGALFGNKLLFCIENVDGIGKFRLIFILCQIILVS